MARSRDSRRIANSSGKSPTSASPQRALNARGSAFDGASEPLECVVVRSDNEAVVVNLDIEPVEKPDEVLWIDPIHKG